MAILSAPRRPAVVVALAAWVLAQAPIAGQAPQTIESNIKAVFLYNFAKYVTWPAFEIGERSPAQIRICVTADDAFFSVLKSAVQGEDVDGRPLLPVALSGLDDARTCQILYVGDSASADARAWFNAVRNTQVLTVGDGLARNEPVIGFVRDDNRLRFDINRAAAGRHNLNISSKLLRLARQVREQ